MKENDKEKRFTLRMDAELFETIKQLAEENKRSIAKQIEFMLSQELNNKSK